MLHARAISNKINSKGADLQKVLSLYFAGVGQRKCHCVRNAHNKHGFARSRTKGGKPKNFQSRFVMSHTINSFRNVDAPFFIAS